MRKLFFILLFFTVGTTTAQQIDTAHDDFRINRLMFHQDFIKLHKIRRIEATNTTKSDGQPIRSGEEYYYWLFDSDGRLTGEGRTQENLLTKVPDTLHYIMRYDHNQNLAYRTELIGNKVKSYHYLYDREGKVIESELKERWNYGHNPPFVMSRDSYTYQTIQDSVVIKKTFNDQGANYREQMFVYDNKERILEKNGRYLRGDIRTKETFLYNSNGYLQEKKIYQDVLKGTYEKYILQHDKIGNIHKIKTYRNDDNKRNIDYIYFDDSILLKAIIDQDVESHNLNILRFEYEYY